MEGSTLNNLLVVCDAAALDLSPEPVDLDVGEGRISAQYCGLYAYAMREYNVDLDPFSAAFPARELARIAKLFSSAKDVKLKYEEPKLAIREGRRRSTVSALASPNEMADTTVDVCAWVNIKALAAEVRIAREAVASSYSAPILTGIRIVAGSDLVGLQACNGASALIEAAIPADTVSALNLVLPVKDLDMALKVCDDGDTEHVGIGTVGRGRFGMVGERSKFVGSTLSGSWPDFGRFRGAADDTVTLPSAVIAEIVDAAQALSTAEDIEFVPAGEETTISVSGKAGAYSTTLDRAIAKPHRMSAKDADIASRLGESIEMGLRDDGSALFTATGGGENGGTERKLYVLNRIGVSSAAST